MNGTTDVAQQAFSSAHSQVNLDAMSMSDNVNVNDLLDPAIPPDIGLSTAPQMVGILLNWCLFGVLSTQVYVYYLSFPDDRVRNKILVYSLYVLEVAQTIMTAADLCFWFATGFGDTKILDRVNLTPFDTPLLCSIIAWIVQCFYAFRIYMLRRSFLWVSSVIVLMSFSQLVGGVIVGIEAYTLGEFSKFNGSAITRPAQVWFLTGIICDILIAVTLVWLLFKSRKESSTRGAGAQILARLVGLVVQTNVLTTVVALISLISYNILPHAGVFKCTTLITGKLYSNALLATLNNRIIARRLEMDDVVFQDMGSLYAGGDKIASVQVGNPEV